MFQEIHSSVKISERFQMPVLQFDLQPGNQFRSMSYMQDRSNSLSRKIIHEIVSGLEFLHCQLVKYLQKMYCTVIQSGKYEYIYSIYLCIYFCVIVKDMEGEEKLPCYAHCTPNQSQLNMNRRKIVCNFNQRFCIITIRKLKGNFSRFYLV